uniref:Heat shock factor protein n=2 Tax=Eukaryota TaxID=2759 RepID=A0A1D1YZ98_9ARAE
MTTAAERIRNNLTNHHMMPSQSNDMLNYEMYNDNNSHVTCSEGESLFQEETGKYDLDTVSVFVAKLYQLLDCDDYKEYLTWNETGDVFVICNMDEFAQNVLPKYFKHCKFTSFVRQLNIYGFYRVSDARKSKHVRSKHACVFSHSQFRRGRQDLLPNIRRKVSKTVRRKPRNTDSSLSQNHVGDGSSSSQSIYGSSSLIKGGNMSKDLNRSNNSLSVFSDSKDFLLGSDRSDNDTIMRERIAELTTTTENLRKDLKQISSIVNDNLLPEVRSLAEGLHKHQEHLLALTQLVTCAFPEGVQLLQDVTRGYTRHMPYEIPKRNRLDDKPTTVKTEQTTLSSSVPTVPSSRVPQSYNLFTSTSSNHNPNNNNNLINDNNPSSTESSLQTTSVTPSALTIPSDTQSTFNNITGSSIMGGFQQSPHNTQPNITGFNETWNNTTSVMITDTVNTVSSANISYNIFPTTTTTQPPILYPHSPSQQHSPPLSHTSQVPSRSSSISLSPPNSNDILNNVPNITSPTQINASGANSPVHQGDVVVASSPASNSSSPISSTVPTSLSNFYHPNPTILDMYHQSFM